MTRDARTVGEIMGEDLNDGVVVNRDDAGTLYEIEVLSEVSRVFDLSRLEVEGLPIGISPAGEQSSLS